MRANSSSVRCMAVNALVLWMLTKADMMLLCALFTQPALDPYAMSAPPHPAPLPAWSLQPARASLLPQIAEMEAESYAADEMCTSENFLYRLQHAAPFFKAAVATEDADASAAPDSAVPRVLGFVVGTLSVSSVLHHEAMFAHAPEGRYLCIHSVVTAPQLRRRGLARSMLRQYVATVKQEQGSNLSAIVLICKEPLIAFYESCGFKLVGRSDVVHGADPWFECRLQIAADDA